MPEGLSVALPIHRDPGTLANAARCILAQTARDLDIMLILNGSDDATRAAARSLNASDSRVRIIELPDANLAAALNTALEAARHPLVARMDADDTCPPGRLALQRDFLNAHPDLAALGCAWELADDSNSVLTVVRPPECPARLRWRLLLGNTLAHGSMMLRRDAVLRAGGYDTRCDRAQDYDLWLRLPGRIACLPDVLYRHRVRDTADPARSTPDQSRTAASRILTAWRALPHDHNPATEAALARGLARDPAAIADLERDLDRAPSAESLLAWLWSQWNTPPAPRRAAEVARRALTREVAARIRAAGATRLWLWGAGDHTRRLLQHPEDLALPVAGLIDDAPREHAAIPVVAPAAIAAGEHVLVSSDWNEHAIWLSAAPHRARGVHVHRLYEP